MVLIITIQPMGALTVGRTIMPRAPTAPTELCAHAIPDFTNSIVDLVWEVNSQLVPSQLELLQQLLSQPLFVQQYLVAEHTQ